MLRCQKAATHLQQRIHDIHMTADHRQCTCTLKSTPKHTLTRAFANPHPHPPTSSSAYMTFMTAELAAEAEAAAASAGSAAAAPPGGGNSTASAVGMANRRWGAGVGEG